VSTSAALDVVGGDATGRALLLVTVAVHVAGGVVAVVAGAGAGVAAKRPGRHPRRGNLYCAALSVVVVTAVVLVAGSPRPAWELLVLAAVSLVAARIGVRANRRRGRYRPLVHIVGMSLSYVGLLTGFFVDNGPRLPLWDRLPGAWFWFLPGLVAAPVVARAIALSRYRVDLPAQADRRPRGAPSHRRRGVAERSRPRRPSRTATARRSCCRRRRTPA
jgi:hypothetical protein